MTAYDDNPLLGEVPDVPARSGVQAVLAAADKLAAAVRAVAEIRELHRSDSWGDCHHCRVARPCGTVRILDKWGL